MSLSEEQTKKKDKISSNPSLTNAKKCYLEITKPPKPGHIGKYLWSPAEEQYWNGKKGKIGLLKQGDIVIHDWKGKIYGYSKVADHPTTKTKDEIISIFKNEKFWTVSYQEFAESWFDKSSSGKFFLVRLEDFKKFEKIQRYGAFPELPPPNKLQGVYLIECDFGVVKKLGILSDEEITTYKNSQLVNYFRLKGYLYPSHLVAQFYVALKTKGFIILSGLTGTGKTKIAQEFVRLFGNHNNKNSLFLSVQPDWRDSKPLLGFYNFLEGRYHKTKLLEFIIEAKTDCEKNQKNAKPYFVILDEMNLAHVEYYFADFLSVLESGRDEDGFTRESLNLHNNEEIAKNGIPRDLKLPPNLYIIGTVNMDETTYSFSQKVLDRAFTIEFHDVDLNSYPPENTHIRDFNDLRQAVLEDLRGSSNKFLARSKNEISEAVKWLRDTSYWKVLRQLNNVLEPYDLHFGYRVVDEIAVFLGNAKKSQEKNIVWFERNDEIFDLALLMKILPKFHGNRRRLGKALRDVLRLCLMKESQIDVDKLRSEDILELLRNWDTKKENFRFKHTARKILRMLRQLYEIGFTSFS